MESRLLEPIATAGNENEFDEHWMNFLSRYNTDYERILRILSKVENAEMVQEELRVAKIALSALEEACALLKEQGRLRPAKVPAETTDYYRKMPGSILGEGNHPPETYGAVKKLLIEIATVHLQCVRCANSMYASQNGSPFLQENDSIMG